MRILTVSVALLTLGLASACEKKEAPVKEAPKQEAAAPAAAPEAAKPAEAAPAPEAPAPAPVVEEKKPEAMPEAKAEAPKPATPEEVTTASGLKYIDTLVGTGDVPQAGQHVTVHYTGWLQSNNAKFDSSVDRGEPFTFIIGRRQVIRGWDEGVMTMKVGGKRKLIIPPELGYGSRGAGDVIPPDSVLVFDVELLAVGQ
jgi:peptidylprolyl isomerase